MFTEILVISFVEGLRNEFRKVDEVVEVAKERMRVIESNVFNVLIEFKE
ncbi:hypothetical protein [Caldicellulosiruptor saccharolyticus]|nr:hypothetical protein [Caldicellulosiruptor saccharolyticus]